MSLPRRFEQVGIVVVGSVLMVSLPFAALSPILSVGPDWVSSFLLCVPGFVVGVLVALDILSVSYGQVWLFAIASWLATALFWALLEIGTVTDNQPTALTTWLIALLVGAVVAWAKPATRFRRSEA